MDKQFGAAWHVSKIKINKKHLLSCSTLQVVMGDRYSFAVEHEAPSMLYMFSGNLAILAWKSGNMLIKVGREGEEGRILIGWF